MAPRKIAFWILGMAAALPLILFAEEKVDLSVIHRIKAEAFENPKVMEDLFYLTDVHGPRLTGSPAFKEAADWVVQRMSEYGITAKEEKWGPFGRGWASKHFEAHMLEPQYQPLIGAPLAWTGSTAGAVTGEPVFVNIRTEADFEKYKGKLQGKIVMMNQARQLPFRTEAQGHRYTDADLEDVATAPTPRVGFRPGVPTGPGGPDQPPATPEEARQRREKQREFQSKLGEFLKSEGALVLVNESRGDGGTVFAQSGGSEDPKRPVPLASAVLSAEHYNRIVRLVEHKIPVKLEFNIQNEIFEKDLDSVNVVAEIPGQGAKKDEIVMLGAHLDSWHSGTGATDNAAGSAVVMEAMRILKAANLPMNRTVRMALWSGEEEGLLGSRAYVKEHFGDRETMKLAAEHSKLAGYFNYDNGTGKIRGIYLQSNDMARPIFEAWLAPFHDLGANTVSIRNTGGTDHQSFDAVGLPGFQFIQDPIEYETRTHHSNMDVYDHIQPGDLMQASAIMASFVYNTAMRDEMLPRKPLPKPQPPRRREGATD